MAEGGEPSREFLAKGVISSEEVREDGRRYVNYQGTGRLIADPSQVFHFHGRGLLQHNPNTPHPSTQPRSPLPRHEQDSSNEDTDAESDITEEDNQSQPFLTADEASTQHTNHNTSSSIDSEQLPGIAEWISFQINPPPRNFTPRHTQSAAAVPRRGNMSWDPPHSSLLLSSASSNAVYDDSVFASEAARDTSQSSSTHTSVRPTPLTTPTSGNRSQEGKIVQKTGGQKRLEEAIAIGRVSVRRGDEEWKAGPRLWASSEDDTDDFNGQDGASDPFEDGLGSLPAHGLDFLPPVLASTPLQHPRRNPLRTGFLFPAEADEAPENFQLPPLHDLTTNTMDTDTPGERRFVTVHESQSASSWSSYTSATGSYSAGFSSTTRSSFNSTHRSTSAYSSTQDENENSASNPDQSSSYDEDNQPPRPNQLQQKRPTKKRVSKTQKAGLMFPVTRTHRKLKEASPKQQKVSETAAVYLTSVLEYMTAELLDVSAIEAAKERKNPRSRRITIQPEDVEKAIRHDEEIKSALHNPIIPHRKSLP